MPDEHTTRNEDTTLRRGDRSADVPSDTTPTGATRAIAWWQRLRDWLPSTPYPIAGRRHLTRATNVRRTWPGTRLALAAAVVVALAAAAVIESTAGLPASTAENPSAAESDLLRRADAVRGADRADRSAREAAAAAARPASATPQTGTVSADPDVAAAEDAAAAEQTEQQETAPAESASPTPEPTPASAAPVAGLSQVQMDNATAIVDAGLALQLPRRALVIAVATAMQESTLLNRASEVLPESKNYPHQGTGWDHDSVGLFQQRTSTGWGAVADLMNPAYAATQFYLALQRVPGWEQMRLTDAAQAVQVSAYPEHYAQHEAAATTVVDAILAGR
ncbi:hypothetical protein ACN27F_05175 [Solwaraspora sp. WMMB335]|uniref:hypothetical protein n=1 Tax=Solwaraspora sp. WMMB335 TaxID=3404118 RepID=UPI003B9630D7